ncbi:hypothetical protein R6Q57_030104 [Mikania cordata]
MSLKETAKKKVEARQNRKTENRNGSKSTIRYHHEHGHGLYSSSGQIDTWRLTNWEEKKGWISKDAAAAYVETLKETCAIMHQILIEKNLMSPLPGPSQDDTSESDENVDE